MFGVLPAYGPVDRQSEPSLRCVEPHTGAVEEGRTSWPPERGASRVNIARRQQQSVLARIKAGIAHVVQVAAEQAQGAEVTVLLGVWGEVQARARPLAGWCLSLRDVGEVLALDHGLVLAKRTLCS